tara:strand:- start:10611 stop:11402 length:792 start_codon:yes stop_codon:yes gene_type:complete
MDKPSIFIIVPTLNSFKILPKLVQSLNAQTNKDWRVLFVDGNSDKKHREYLKTTCSTNSKFEWIVQSSNNGIYGAMNHGFSFASQNEWVLFLGSDDWLSSRHSFSEFFNLLDRFHDMNPDLIISRAQYVDTESGELGRVSTFETSKGIYTYNNKSFRKKLFLGSSPPHQGTFYSKKTISFLQKFDENLTLVSDLDSFLRISKYRDLNVLAFDNLMILMSKGGKSGQQTLRRTKEVIEVYLRHFNILFFIPFVLRYFQRAVSLF